MESRCPWPVVAAVAVVLSSCGGGGPEAPASGDELAARVGEAAVTKSRQDLRGLVKWEGVSPDMRESLEGMVDLLMRHDVAAVAPEGLPNGYRETRVRYGVIYTPNVNMEGMLRVTFGADRPVGTRSITMPYGRDAAGYHIAGTVETAMPMGTAGTEDVSINFIVMSGGADAPVEFEGACTVIRSGVEVAEPVAGAGTLTKAVWGQSVRDCSVHRTSSAGWLELRIVRGGERVFSSERADGSDPIVYEAPPPRA